MTEEQGGAAVPMARSVAEQMRSARDAAGLTLADVAARTRVPLRHLEALERGDYGALPGVTYCAGFTRAYARAVGLDPTALVAALRRELDDGGEFNGGQRHIEEAADPARVPPRSLAWIAGIAALLISGGYALWRMQVTAPPVVEVQPAAAPLPKPVQAPPRLAPAPAAPVALTASQDVWLRIYDGTGKAFFEGTLLKGNSFTVPADAKGPMIRTGRADALSVTVGGRPVPALGSGKTTVSDLPISAVALLARPAEPVAVPVSAPSASAAASAPSRGSNTPTGQSRAQTEPRATSADVGRSSVRTPSRNTQGTSSPTSAAPRTQPATTPTPVPAPPAPQPVPAPTGTPPATGQ